MSLVEQIKVLEHKSALWDKVESALSVVGSSKSPISNELKRLLSDIRGEAVNLPQKNTEADLERKAKSLIAMNLVSKFQETYIVLSASLTDRTSSEITLNPVGKIVCTCRMFNENFKTDNAFRCEHIRAVKIYANEHQPNAKQSDMPYLEPVAKFDGNPIAKSLNDLVTRKQLGMIRAIAREIGVDEELKSDELFTCKLDELSKKAASHFIGHLQHLQKETEINNPKSAKVLVTDPIENELRNNLIGITANLKYNEASANAALAKFDNLQTIELKRNYTAEMTGKLRAYRINLIEDCYKRNDWNEAMQAGFELRNGEFDCGLALATNDAVEMYFNYLVKARMV